MLRRVAVHRYSLKMSLPFTTRQRLITGPFPKQQDAYFHMFISAKVGRWYHGPVPSFFDGREFKIIFCISRSWFQCLTEDIGSKGIKFYTSTVDACNKQGASMEAHLLLALKTIAMESPSTVFVIVLEFAFLCAAVFCSVQQKAEFIKWDALSQVGFSWQLGSKKVSCQLYSSKALVYIALRRVQCVSITSFHDK